MIMKRNLTGLCLCALALASLLPLSCEKVDTDAAGSLPALTVSSTISAATDGGQYSFTYEVTDPAEDGSLSCLADVSWIGDFDLSSAGTVGFTVSANDGTELRGGNITVTYSYSGGTAVKSVGVFQNGTFAPELTVQPTAVTAAMNGGEYSFTYSVANPVDGGEVTCSVDADWIGNFDFTDYGTVIFTVDENESVKLRTAEITVAYNYSGASLSSFVSVVQDHGSGNVEDILGVYEASGPAYSSTDFCSDQTWTLTIYDDMGNYVLVDGLTPQYAGGYEKYGDHRCSANAYYEDGKIIVPSQISEYAQVVSGGVTYYFGFTPCTYFSFDEGFCFDAGFPDLVFTYNEDSDTWQSNYGMFAAGFPTTSLSSFTGVVFDMTAPVTTLRKTGPLPESLSVAGTVECVATQIEGEAVPIAPIGR